MVELPSWQAQLSGTKTWTLTPPPECAHICHPFNVTVNKGDISELLFNFNECDMMQLLYMVTVVLDTNKWYHQTEILPGNISITIGSEYR